MTTQEKLALLKSLLELDEDDTQDDRLSAFLAAAERELISWRYSYAESVPDTVPYEYEMTQIYAVVAGFNLMGAENQTMHSENGVNRTFRHSSMQDYIRAHTVPIARVVVR